MSKFTIKIMGQVFESDEDGFLNLNDIWRGCALDRKNRPSEWRNKDSKYFRQTAKLRSGSEIKELGKPPVPYLKADEDATIGYSMWISTEFYVSVVTAFRELRQGNLQSAVEIASNTMSEADAHYLKRQSRLKGMTWDESCAWAGIKHSQKCREMLIEHPRFKFFDKHSGKYFVTEEGQETDYFYDRGNKFTKNTTMRVSPEGRIWLRENRDWFNKATEVYMNAPIVH